MKKFRNNKSKIKFDLIFLLIVVLTIIFLRYYNNNISTKMLNIISSKLEEISTLYIKKDIMPQVKLDQLVNIHLNEKEEIIYVDVNYDYANMILVSAVSKIQKNILKLEHGNLNDFENNKELKKHGDNLYMLLPVGLAYNGVLFSNIGPKIPVKISFFEHVLGNVDTEITNYGINNALLTIKLNISLEQKILIPYKEKKMVRNYSLTIGSKIINGRVPNIYGGALSNSSNIIQDI